MSARAHPHHIFSHRLAQVARTMVSPLVTEVHILGELHDELQKLVAELAKPLRLPAGEIGHARVQQRYSISS